MFQKASLYLLLLAALLLSACAQATAAPTSTATTAPSDTPAPPTATTAPTATFTSTPAEVVISDSCVACHLDKQMLIDTAKVEEAVESESEGVG